MCESNFWIFVIALTKKGESRRLSRPTAWGRKISCFQFVYFAVITAGISRLPVVKFNRSDGKIEKGVVVFFGLRGDIRIGPVSTSAHLLSESSVSFPSQRASAALCLHTDTAGQSAGSDNQD